MGVSRIIPGYRDKLYTYYLSTLCHKDSKKGKTQFLPAGIVEDSPKGPLNNRGETHLKPAKNANTNELAHLTHIHSTTTILVAPAARRDNTASDPRVKPASLEG
jgi:hypothetical protein